MHSKLEVTVPKKNPLEAPSRRVCSNLFVMLKVEHFKYAYNVQLCDVKLPLVTKLILTHYVNSGE